MFIHILKCVLGEAVNTQKTPWDVPKRLKAYLKMFIDFRAGEC